MSVLNDPCLFLRIAIGVDNGFQTYDTEEFLEIGEYEHNVLNLAETEAAQAQGNTTFFEQVLSPIFNPPAMTTTSTTTTTVAPVAFPTPPLDLVFIVDVSGSVGNANFERMVAFVSAVVGLLDANLDGVRCVASLFT